MTDIQHFAFVELPVWVMAGGLVFTLVVMGLIAWLDTGQPPKPGE
jgi:hypothetical protein